MVARDNVANQETYSSSGGLGWCGVWSSYPITAAPNNRWYGVTYGANKFVAVSDNGTSRFMTSSDGVNWTLGAAGSPASDSTWNDVRYVGDTFVATAWAGTNRIMISKDGGNTWIGKGQADGVLPLAWTSPAYGDGKIVAVTAGGLINGVQGDRVIRSTNGGDTWESFGVEWGVELSGWSSVVYSPEKNLFVAVARNGTNRVMTSNDGQTWSTSGITGVPVSTWSSITYSPDKELFVAVSTSSLTGEQVMTSHNGKNWTSRTSADGIPANSWQSVTYGNGRFVAVASNGTNRVMESQDGNTWKSYGNENGIATSEWWRVSYGDGKFISGAQAGTNKIMVSP